MLALGGNQQVLLRPRHAAGRGHARIGQAYQDAGEGGLAASLLASDHRDRVVGVRPQPGEQRGNKQREAIVGEVAERV